jgi:hypothetical protein
MVWQVHNEVAAHISVNNAAHFEDINGQEILGNHLPIKTTGHLGYHATLLAFL